MEKVYMEAPKQNQNRMWRPEDISPYDFRDPQTNQNSMNDTYEFNENDLDMDAILNEMNAMDNESSRESDMYDNQNIDWQCNEDVSQRPYHTQVMDRKTIVEEENPKRKTTTWMRVTRQY